MCYIPRRTTPTPTHQALGNRCHGEFWSTNLKTKLKRNSNREVDESSKVDHVVTSASSSRFEDQLYIFEDNHAVNQNDHKGQKSYDETRIQNPQSSVGFVV